MRIVYLHQYFITPQMAGGSRSYEMARRLVAAGHEVHMVTSDQAGAGTGRWTQSIEAGIQVHWADVPYRNDMPYRDRIAAFLRFAWMATTKARQLRGDVVFATSTPLTIAIPAVRAARHCRIPMVFEVRDLWPAVPIAIGALSNPVLKWAARRLERYAYANASRIVALAPGMRDEIIATGVPADRVTVIPNGSDLDIFSGMQGSPDPRSTHEWLGDRPLVVFTGTFGLVNGMDYLVRIAAATARTDPEVRFVAVGDGREFPRTMELARELGVLDSNLFLMGKLPKLETAAWVRVADMTIALFTGPEIVWRDAVQNKFFDSLAAGTPVANNFAGWQARVAEEAGAGIILSATNTDAASADLVHRLRDDAWLRRAGEAARTLAVTRFNRDDLAGRLQRLLEDVVGQPG
jgi:glycosyltransferase involved in cell wall biosynthesis